MRRRVDDDDDAGVTAPPDELVNYEAFCAGRRLRPYGDADDERSMRRAVGQWEAWMGHRVAWAAAHGLDEDDIDLVGSAPWGAAAL